MKTIHKILVAVVLVVVGVVVYQQVAKPMLDDRMVARTVIMPIENEPLGFGFRYPSGETAYTLIEPPVPTTTSSGLQKAYLLFDTAAYQSFEVTADTETPPSVSVFVFALPSEDNDDIDRKTQLQTWIEAHAPFTSYGLKTTELEVTELDGVLAYHYRAEGLYQQEVYVAMYRDHVYVFTGQFIAEEDAIRTMFNDLVASAVFY